MVIDDGKVLFAESFYNDRRCRGAWLVDQCRRKRIVFSENQEDDRSLIKWNYTSPVFPPCRERGRSVERSCPKNCVSRLRPSLFQIGDREVPSRRSSIEARYAAFEPMAQATLEADRYLKKRGSCTPRSVVTPRTSSTGSFSSFDGSHSAAHLAHEWDLASPRSPRKGLCNKCNKCSVDGTLCSGASCMSISDQYEALDDWNQVKDPGQLPVDGKLNKVDGGPRALDRSISGTIAPTADVRLAVCSTQRSWGIFFADECLAPAAMFLEALIEALRRK